MVQRATLVEPGAGEWFLITAFSIAQTTECAPNSFPSTATYTDRSGVTQSIGLITAYSDAPDFISSLTMDIPPQGIEVAGDGELIIRTGLLGCEPETSVTEFDVQGSICLDAVAVESSVESSGWGTVKATYR